MSAVSPSAGAALPGIDPRRLERLIGAGLAAFGLLHLTLFTVLMLPTSLWIDEIISIRDFSSEGLWTVLSQYPEPNNHIFYNALLSLLPGRGSYDAVTARLPSALATFLMIGLLAGYFWRRQRFLEAGLIVVLLGASFDLLAILLQARGYGLQALLLVIVFILAGRIRPPVAAGSWIALGTAAVLSLWTTPSALLLLAPVGVLALSAPTLRRGLLALYLAMGVGLLILHLPLLGSFLQVYTSYGAEHGRQFAELSALHHLGTIIFGPLPPAARAVVGLLLLGGILLAAVRACPASRAALLWTLGFVGAVGLAALMTSPPPRVFAPFVPILWAVGCWSLGSLIRALPRPAWRHIGAFVAAALPFVLNAEVRKPGSVRYLPIENWKGVADLITSVLPPETVIGTRARPELLPLFLPPGYPVHLATSARPSWSDGFDVLVDSHFTDGERWDEDDFADPVLFIRVPQLRGRYQAVVFPAPPTLPTVGDGALPDVPGTLFRAPPEKSVHACLLLRQQPEVEAFPLTGIIETDGRLTAAEGQWQHFDGVSVLPLGRPVAGVVIGASGQASDTASAPRVAFTYRHRDPPAPATVGHE
jgi:hypothetical protein